MKNLIIYELKELFRHSFVKKLLIVLPLIMIFIMPWTGTQDFRDMRVCIIDYDGSYASERLIQKIDASRIYSVTAVVATYEQALRLMEHGDAEFIVEIQQDFESNLFNGMANVLISADNTTTMTGGLGASYLTNLLADFASEMRSENLANINAPKVTQYNIDTKYLYNPQMDYKIFLFPVLLVIILSLISSFLPALVTNGQNNLQQDSFSLLILSKTIPYIFIGSLIVLFYVLLIWLVFGFPIGNIGTIFTVSILYLFTVSCFSIFIGNLCKDSFQTMLTMFVLVFSGILLSGLTAPIWGLPWGAKLLSGLNPIRFCMEAIRFAYIKGSTVSEIFYDLYALAHYGILNYILALLSYYYQQKNLTRL